MLQAIQAHDWKTAEALAAQEADKLAPKLVVLERLLQPGQAAPGEILDFITANPSWPEQGVLRKRLGEALAADKDDAETRALCAKARPAGEAALLRCAAAEKQGGNAALAQAYARQAWLSGVTAPAAEDAFLAEWAASIGADDQWHRFDTLAWGRESAAERQVARVDESRRALAAARWGLAHADARAKELLAAVPAAQRGDPILLLEQARYLRAQNDLPGALALWRASVAAAEAAAPAERRAAFYTERERLARLLLVAKDFAGAYYLADDAQVGADQAPDALFLSGWIAVRRLNDPVKAAAKFKALGGLSASVITQARSWFWLSETETDEARAAADLKRAAVYVTTFYGQRALARIENGDVVTARIKALRDPAVSAAQARAFAALELVRAATVLAGWGDVAQARAFLQRQAQAGLDATNLTLTATVATDLGLPDVAVQAARLAGRQGIMMPHLGWPEAYRPPAKEVSVPLAVMRQESSFDPLIVSSAGAVGLMQMMPETARQIGRGDGSLTDPAYNIRTGMLYFQKLMKEFSGQLVYALAAYNGGARNVHDWIATYGDAFNEGSPSDMLDWMEQVPFPETRNYLQRVLENRTIYTAMRPPP